MKLVFEALFLPLQVQLREYVFDSRHRPTFGEDDIINMFPVVKHLTFSGAEATGLVQRARVLIHQGEKQIQPRVSAVAVVRMSNVKAPGFPMITSNTCNTFFFVFLIQDF